jgi:hypothetical protein
MIFIQRICFFICLCTMVLFSASKDISVQFMVLHEDKGLINGDYFVDIGLYSGVTFDTPLVSTKNVSVKFTEGVMTYKLTITDPYPLEAEDLYVGMKVISLDEASVFVPLVSVPSAIYATYAKESGTIKGIADWLKIDVDNERLGIGIMEPDVALSVSGNVSVSGGMVVTGSVNATSFSGDGSRITNITYGNIEGIDTHYLSPQDAAQNYVVFVDEYENVGIGVTSNIQAKLEVVGTVNVTGSYVGFGNIDISNGTNGLNWLVSNGALGVGEPGNSLWENKTYTYLFGKEHTIDSDYAAIVGGLNNSIGDNSEYSTVLGGNGNDIILAKYATVLGGYNNDINNANYSAILGGNNNKVDAHYSVVLGGEDNQIDSGADHSVAMGKNSKINHSGVFLFSDSTGTAAESFSNDQFLIFAENGVGIGTNNVSGTPYYGAGSVSQKSLRVVGDVDVGGYLYGNGSRLTNVSTAWTQPEDDYIYVTKNVVIGTTSKHSQKLYVAGDVTVTGNLIVIADIRHTLGKVSVGTEGEDAIFSHVGSNTGTSFALNQSSDGATTVNAAMGKSIALSINNDAKMRIDSDGKVAILGSVGDDDLLSVNGTVNATAFSGSGADLTGVEVNGIYSDADAVMLDAASGDSVTVNSELRVIGPGSGAIVLQNNSDAFISKLESKSINEGLFMTLTGVDNGTNPVFSIHDGSDSLVKFYKNGAVYLGGALSDPGWEDSTHDRLFVSGNARVSNRLYVAEEIHVSGNIIGKDKVTIENILHLTPLPLGSPPDPCVKGDVFAVSGEVEGVNYFDVCVCVDEIATNSLSLTAQSQTKCGE